MGVPVQNLFLLSRWMIGFLISVFVVALLTFGILHALPGTPFDDVLPESIKVNWLDRYALTASLPLQFLAFIRDFVSGNFGDSILHSGLSVRSAVTGPGLRSIELGFWALMWALSLGVWVGMSSQQWPMRVQQTVNLAIRTGLVMPSFVTASVLSWVFVFLIPVFPAALWESSLHKVLPVLCVGFRPFCFVCQIIRTTNFCIQAPVLRIALLAKGMSSQRILWHHQLPFACGRLIPVLGPLMTDILTGSLIVELIFGINGLSFVFLRAIEERDYNLVLGLTLYSAVILILISQLLELLRVRLDPRNQSVGLQSDVAT